MISQQDLFNLAPCEPKPHYDFSSESNEAYTPYEVVQAGRDTWGQAEIDKQKMRAIAAMLPALESHRLSYAHQMICEMLEAQSHVRSKNSNVQEVRRTDSLAINSPRKTHAQ
jgi:hypothetical protein